MTTTLSPTEINRRVAEICGDENRHDWQYVGGNVYGTFYVCNRCNSTSSEDDGPPTDECVRDFWHDANAALWAAERAGLFFFGRGDEGSRFMDRVIDGGVVRWRVCAHYYRGDEIRIRVIQTADSFPAAICLAILALKENQT